MDIAFREIPEINLKKKPEKGMPLGFGHIFSDYMFSMKYDKEKGWYDPLISKYENISLPPSTIVFHYAQEIFEGMKAYKRADGKYTLFRPKLNYKRFNLSAARMCMPAVPVKDHEQAMKELLKIEKDWFPDTKKGTMYIRPTMIAMDPALGVRESKTYLFFIILSPSGYYFASGSKPVNVMVQDKYVRAALGGTGAAKTGGNYAASLLAGKLARENNCQQVLWLDSKEKKYIEEVGAMNICFVLEGKKIITSKLNGSILDGVTRNSVLKLGPHIGLEVEERNIEINEVIDGIKSGKVTECFGCGTAAVIQPVGQLHYKNKFYYITDKVGPVSKKLYDELTGIQWGFKEDILNWMQIID